jgi:hypothetical protein
MSRRLITIMAIVAASSIPVLTSSAASAAGHFSGGRGSGPSIKSVAVARANAANPRFDTLRANGIKPICHFTCYRHDPAVKSNLPPRTIDQRIQGRLVAQ